MPLVLPHSVNVKLIITSKDVLHSFAVPALGIKMDAVPGRLNQVTVFITQPGVYYGQCSELCGVNHAFMPITIHAISFELYEQFLIKIAIAQEADKIAIAMEKFFATEGHLFLDEPSDNESEEGSSESLNQSSEDVTKESQEPIESNPDIDDPEDFCTCE
jgi:heme/copper-type cytochrome/quinol oxidase subunit 2